MYHVFKYSRIIASQLPKQCHQNTFTLDAYVEYAIIGSDGSSCKDTQKL